MFSNIKKFINNSLFVENIDNLGFILLLSILFSAIVCQSEIMGVLALCFTVLMLFCFIFKNQSKKLVLTGYDKAVFIYFLFVTVSLFSSSLFSLSLHGYIKTFIYTSFFFAVSYYFKNNKDKIFLTILFGAALMTYESLVAIIQNKIGISEISGWQDMTHINPEQVVSRAYGTLKPYNPNLLAGYLLCGLSSFVYLILHYLDQKKKRIALIFTALFIICLIAIIDTGCRGAYLGFLLFFPCLFFALAYYIQKRLGGFSNLKKRYKNVSLFSAIGVFLFVVTNPALLNRFESIFALRSDSSISFRFNVYESAFKMFLDNPFLGIGVGNQNFREIYGLYMKTGYDALGSYCVPLEIAVESGIFALLSFLVFICLSLYYCFKICKSNTTTNKNKILALSVALMIFAVMGHGLFDTIWFRPQVQLLFWTNIAMLKSIED